MTEKFAHESERFISEILSHHDIKWEYEPKTLVLIKDEEGVVRRAFTPDFYLPEFDTYVEVTVMKKPNKKRKKIEMALKTFPTVNIILLCRDDIKELIEEYKFISEPCID